MEILPTNKQNLIVPIMRKNSGETRAVAVKAFTLVETLLTLMIVSFIYLGLSGSIRTSFQQVGRKVIFAEFEHLYQESQKIALARQTELDVGSDCRKIQTPSPDSGDSWDSVILQDPKTISFRPSQVAIHPWPMFTFRHREEW